jgi:hypothetical protein
MMRKGGGEELVAASKQFRRSRGARLGLVALTVGHSQLIENFWKCLFRLVGLESVIMVVTNRCTLVDYVHTTLRRL